MISNELIQAAIIAKAKASATIIASPLSSGTILEYNYQGTDWEYPCVRLQLESNTKDIDSLGGCPSIVEFSWYVFSEQGSSKQVNQLAGRIVAVFEDLSFTQNGIKFSSIKILENIPAIRQDVRTWRAQIRCRSVIHLA